MKYLLAVALLAIVETFAFTSCRPSPVEVCEVNCATCLGGSPCHACKNCKYCSHCAKQGGTCGACR